MSSLSAQLQNISQQTASVALDRKSRSKLHSRSLIYDPKKAATQDYDFIYSVCVEGFEELVEIDSRFSKFHQTLFSETSINTDRNVQSLEVVEVLNKNIEAFLTLLGPYWLLTPAIKSVEWLVRRFYINIHQLESLLLSTLPYYSNQLFVKVLNVIPKANFPPIFQWVIGYKDLLKCPTQSSLIKAFIDPQFFKLFNDFIAQQLQTNTIYKESLVLCLSNNIQVMANLSKDLNKFQEDGYLNNLLQVIGKLLLPRTQSNINHDCKLTAYSLIAVLGSIVPLSEILIQSLTKSIVEDKSVFDNLLKRQTFIVLGQLWEGSSTRGFPITSLKAINRSAKNEEFVSIIKDLQSEGYKVNKFLVLYVVTEQQVINLNQLNLLDLVSFNVDDSNDFDYILIVNWLLTQLQENQQFINEPIRKHTVLQFEKLLKAKPELFEICLQKFKAGFKVNDLEMMLMSTLDSGLTTKNNDLEINFEADENEDDLIIEDEAVDEVLANSARLTPVDESFLYDTAPFVEYSKVLLGQLSKLEVASQKLAISKFSQSAFQTPEAAITFFLRVAYTPSIPFNIRLLSLRFIKLRLKELSNIKDKDYEYYLLTPLLILGLYANEKSIRSYIVEILKIVQAVSQQKKKLKSKSATLFLEEYIYKSVENSNRAITSPADALKLLELFTNDTLHDIIVDKLQLLNVLQDTIFKPKAGKKFGQLFKTFIITQWSLQLSIVFKKSGWDLTDDNKYTEINLTSYEDNRAALEELCVSSKISFEQAEGSFVNLVGKFDSNTHASAAKSVEWLVNALSSKYARLQVLADEKIIEILSSGSLKSLDLKLKIVTKYIDLLVNEESLEIDPVDSLQSLVYDHDLILSILDSVQISTQIPEPGVPKRRRRSSSSTRQNMARDDINNMATTHLKKLTIVLDLLETILKKESSNVAAPDLLQSLFKSLTDLDYLGNDGNLPVLYAQETLATCMLLSIVQMKNQDKEIQFDSNSVRADLIVNSIRSSQSPQVQNRLLLVIAELAALAPEIILHSVMPIFTFMGAHTIRQDDEFSNSVLQQTISKVIPAIAANGSSTLSNEIEFLLTSFAAAFQHIPRHRRVKLFTTLTKTLDHDQSLHIILFLMGQQYAKSAATGTSNTDNSNAVVEFSTLLLKHFSASEQLVSLSKFYELWSLIPDQTLDVESEKFKELSSRSIFGASVLSLSNTGLIALKSQLLKFIDDLLSKKQQDGLESSASDLKLKIALILLDEKKFEQQAVLEPFRNSIAFLLSSLETYTSNGMGSEKLLNNLYKLLSGILDLLPIDFFIDSIIEPLNDTKSRNPVAVRVAKNLCILAGTKIDTELNSNNIDEVISEAILDKLLPTLIANISNENSEAVADDVELQQALLGTFSTIVEKMGSSSSKLNEAKYASVIIDSLKVITTNRGLLSDKPEVIISSINAISSVVNTLGVKVIGFFPKIIPPVLKIWKTTENVKVEEDEENDSASSLLQTAILILLSCFVKKMPAFMNSTLDSVLITIFNSNLVDTNIRSNVLQLVIQHMDKAQLLKTLCKIWCGDNFYQNDNVATIGLYLNTLEKTIEVLEKKTAISNSTVFVKWLIQAFEFRDFPGIESKFDNNTIRRLESSFHASGIAFVMKLNDKSFRPLFAQIVRWATTGEGSSNIKGMHSNEPTRLLAFFKFFNKMQDQLRSIVTSYFTYLIDPVADLLQRFANAKLEDVNLRRVVLNSLTSSFKYDQDDFWSQQLRFETIFEPLLTQLYNIEDSIGKYVVKAITSFTVNVSSDEYNEKLIHGMIQYISNDNEKVTSLSKIWSIRVLKSIFQKMGDQWLSFLPTLIPYIAELLEDDDEEVELEVRKGLVRVIENVLGEPLDRYLD